MIIIAKGVEIYQRRGKKEERAWSQLMAKVRGDAARRGE